MSHASSMLYLRNMLSPGDTILNTSKMLKNIAKALMTHNRQTAGAIFLNLNQARMPAAAAAQQKYTVHAILYAGKTFFLLMFIYYRSAARVNRTWVFLFCLAGRVCHIQYRGIDIECHRSETEAAETELVI